MISQGEGCREDVGGGGWQHTRQTSIRSALLLCLSLENYQLQNFIPLGYLS